MKREPHQETENERTLRPGMRKEMEEGGRTTIAQESFTRDAGRLWNRAPEKIKKTKTLTSAKIAIKEYCKTLPIQNDTEDSKTKLKDIMITRK